MPKISEVELYHKDIHKKYATLYIKMTIENYNITIDDISGLLQSYFTENKQPFGSDKRYEVCLYLDYFILDENIELSNSVKLEEYLYSKAEIIRNTLKNIGINVDTVYAFGDKIDTMPKIVIEIEEHEKANDSNIFIMPTQEIYKKLLNYYKKLLIEIFLKNKPLSDKKRNKVVALLNEKYMLLPHASQNEVDKYLWAMRIDKFGKKDKLDYRVFDKKKNGYLSFSFDNSEFWVQSVFTKVNDEYLHKEFRKMAADFFYKRMNYFYNELFENVHNYYIVCNVLNIPYTTNEVIIQKAFIEQYEDLGSFSDKEAEKAYHKLANKTNDIIHKSNFVIKSGNQILIGE